MKANRLNDEERRLWVLNDETLYNAQRVSGFSVKRYVREFREEIDEHINQQLNKEPAK
jgi:hypothetical protein